MSCALQYLEAASGIPLTNILARILDPALLEAAFINLGLLTIFLQVT